MSTIFSAQPRRLKEERERPKEEMELLSESMGVALEIIRNTNDMADNVCVNKYQCKRLAERFCAIGKALTDVSITEHIWDTFLDTSAMDQILTVLKKGEALVRDYADERSALRNVLYRVDNREAFTEVHEEIDSLGTYLKFDQTEKNKLLSSDAETDRGEIIDRAHKLIVGDMPKDTRSMDGDAEGDVENMEKAVTEKCYDGESNAKDLCYLNIPFSAIHFDGFVRELIPSNERKSQADVHLDGLALVYKGRWNGCDCAIKVFKSADIHWNTEVLHKEIASLVKLRHPHIIQLIGCGQHYDNAYVLYEVMDSDLRSLINSRMKRIFPECLQDDRPFSRTEAVSIITQIAKGMLFVHEKGIVHGELKCANLLVKEVGDYIDVKIANCDSSRQLGQAPTTKYKPAHHPRWMPPETFYHYNVDQPSDDLLQKGDIYSFAMTCYEVVTGKYPFDGVRGKALEEKIKAGERPELPEDLSKDLKRLIAKCWHEDPEERPSFRDICYVLKVDTVHLISQVEKLFPSCLSVQEPVGDVLEGQEWNDLFPELNELKIISIQEIDDASKNLPHYLKIKPSELKPLRLLGKGASAEVFEASWIGCRFAVKWLKLDHMIKLRQEVGIMMKLLHPHVIRLVGFSVLFNRCAIVMELMDTSLRDLIDSRIKSKHPVPFSESEALGVIKKLALGMYFLHSRGVTHGDLKCANVLARVANSIFDVKIVDFGLCQFLGENSPEKQSDTVGRWRAPEIIENMESRRPLKRDLFEAAADVFSFSMTCYEIVTGKYPYEDVRGKALEEKIKAGERPELPIDLNIVLKRLITRCWHADPKRRPSFESICYVLQRDTVNLTSQVEKLSSYVGMGNQESVARKGIPTRNWIAEEVRAMLEFMEEALRGDAGPDLWKMVSENLWIEYGFDRASTSCQQQWSTLLRSYSAIQGHESKIQSGTSSWASYWKMNEDERSTKKLLHAFDLEWCDMIERILTTKPSHMDADLFVSALPLCESQLSMDHLSSVDCDLVQYYEVMDSSEKTEEIDTHSEDEELSVESTATIDHMAEVTEDDLVSRIAPFVKKQMEDALKPLITVMLRHREKLIPAKNKN